jgi:hypothetical protein
VFSLTGLKVSKGNHPKIAEDFRLVNYYKLPTSFQAFARANFQRICPQCSMAMISPMNR